MAKDVTVTIDANQRITCKPDTLDLRQRGNNLTLRWEISPDSPAWQFTATGIALKPDAPADPQLTDFEKDKSVGNGKGYQCKDVNSDGLTYSYLVQLTNGTATIELDPTVINRGGTTSN